MADFSETHFSTATLVVHLSIAVLIISKPIYSKASGLYID